MPASLVELNDHGTVGVFLSHPCEKALKTLGIIVGERIEEMLARGRFHHPVERSGLAGPSDFAHQFDSTSGNAATGQGFEAKTDSQSPVGSPLLMNLCLLAGNVEFPVG